MTDNNGNLVEALNERSRSLFRKIVESYLETGEPVGSRTLSQTSGLGLSAASIRNVMADLEQMGLLMAPHTSAGRLPTHTGLRLFVDGLLEVGDLSSDERQAIQEQISGSAHEVEDVLTQASSLLSGLCGGAGLVTAEKADMSLKHIEFVSLSPGQALAVMVAENGDVENRVIQVPPGMPQSTLVEATNYVNARLRGQTLDEARDRIHAEIENQQAELDGLAAQIVEQGLATWSGGEGGAPQLIVRGRANLLDNVTIAEDLERIRMLFQDLETKNELIQLLELAKDAEGVRIFIGAENKLFSLSGSSVIAAPYMNNAQKVVGVIGVIGPTRLNYARVIPMVDYTAKLIGRVIK